MHACILFIAGFSDDERSFPRAASRYIMTFYLLIFLKLLTARAVKAMAADRCHYHRFYIYDMRK